MANDLTTRLLLNSNQFDNNIRNATKEVQKFQKMSATVSNGVKSSFGNIISIAGKIAPQIGLAMGAYEAFDKLIHSSEKNIDDWGRTLKTGESIVNSFFKAINNGDFSSFIDGLKDVIANAREAYNAIDELGTFMMFSDVQTDELNEKIAKYKYNIKAGIDVEVNKEKLKKAEGELKELKLGEKTRATNAYHAVIKDVVQGGKGLTNDKVDKVFNNYNSFSEMKSQAKAVNDEITKLNHTVDKGTITTYGMGGVTYKSLSDEAKKATSEIARLKKENKTLLAMDTADEEKLKEGFKLRRQSAKAGENYWNQKSADLKVLNKGGSTKTAKSSGSTNGIIPMQEFAIEYKVYGTEQLGYYQEQVERLKEQLNDPSLTREKYIKIKIKLDKAEKELDKFKSGNLFDIPKIDANKITEGLDAKRMEQYAEAVEKAKMAQEAMQSTMSSMGSTFSSLGQAIGGTTGSVLEMAGATMQAIAQIIPQIIALIGVKEAEALASGTASGAGLPFPANIAAIASIIATITALFASFAGKFAEGGIVGGSSYSGDKLWARVNSGEMVLNKGQQANLVNMLGTPLVATSPMQGNVQFKIHGKELVGVLNNYSNKNSKVR